jgi:DNA-binding transcriptional MerR regulator
MEVGEGKKTRIGEVADMFGISGQTIRNWLKNDELKGLFSPGATPPPGRQAEFTSEDIQLINSIWSITSSGNHDWRSIAENLKSGWREAYLPSRAAFTSSAPDSTLQLAAKLARAEADLDAERRITRILEEQVENLKALAAKSDEYRTKLIEAELELRLYREGRLKPRKGEGE